MQELPSSHMILPIVCLDNTMACKQKSPRNLVEKCHTSDVKATDQIPLMNMLAQLAPSFQSYSTHYKQRMLFSPVVQRGTVF